jgi:hypothetical protein
MFGNQNPANLFCAETGLKSMLKMGRNTNTQHKQFLIWAEKGDKQNFEAKNFPKMLDQGRNSELNILFLCCLKH